MGGRVDLEKGGGMNPLTNYDIITMNNVNFLVGFCTYCCFFMIMRKATGFKSLCVNCWEINQATLKYQMYFFNKTCRKGLK